MYFIDILLVNDVFEAYGEDSDEFLNALQEYSVSKEEFNYWLENHR